MKILDILFALVIYFISFAYPSFANQPEFFIKSTDTNSETKLPRRSNYGNDLFVKDEGREYLIQNEDLSYWSYYKKIIHNVDLDNDGINEAIVEASDGGGHGIIKYFIISKRGENFYSVYSNSDFEGCCLKLLNKNILSVYKYDKGINVTSQAEEIALFKFQNGNLIHLSTSQNEAFIPAFKEINSYEIDKNVGSKFMTGYYDNDSTIDKLTCNYWKRWGSIICEVHSSVYGIIKINSGCKRIGILKTSNRGLKDLVCGKFIKLIFNGKNYISVDGL
ncbi:hypothetical protein N8370_05775 [Amylibacter sp.]|nr:hypothetical protein [Amylibacter sp.]|tara:strand:- start:1590 stop:2420 length:831 start_codon:yes stop_codon:yes gene_type:complete